MGALKKSEAGTAVGAGLEELEVEAEVDALMGLKEKADLSFGCSTGAGFPKEKPGFEEEEAEVVLEGS